MLKTFQNLNGLPGSAGIKSIHGFHLLVICLLMMMKVFDPFYQKTRRRSAFHSEDEYRLRKRMNERVENDPASHSIWRDEECALQSTRRLVKIARETCAKIHILHLSTTKEVDFLIAHKKYCLNCSNPLSTCHLMMRHIKP